MHAEGISGLEALSALLGIIAFSLLFYRIVPAVAAPAPVRSFTDADLRRQDHALPKYAIVSVAAIMLGSLHLAVRSLPFVSDWLWTGGYGAHLVRDIAYSHMMVVMGGTVGITGLTWHHLPRVLGRPLYSMVLAELAFWFTVLGAAGFYIANVAFGTAMTVMSHQGLSETAIADATGVWRGLTVGSSATVMGVGYWIFVINVLATVALARRESAGRRLPTRARFFVAGVAGLLFGTIQGVLQVMPESEAWLHVAGTAGAYIDPISHAHVNLVTGVLVLLAGFFFQTFDDGRASRQSVAEEQFVFWSLVPGSLALYLTFLVLGFAEGDLIVSRGMSFEGAVATMGWRHSLPLIISGAVTLVGVAALIAAIVRRCFAGRWSVAGTPVIGAGALLLGIGASQGGFQLLPFVKAWMVAAGVGGQALANAHAQLNIAGGVLLIMLGLTLARARQLIGVDIPASLVRRVAIVCTSGILLYYVAAVSRAIELGHFFAELGTGSAATIAGLARQEWLMAAGALLYGGGVFGLLRFVWSATGAARRMVWQELLARLKAGRGEGAPWRAFVPKPFLLLPEALAGLFGFPGLGWILSGRPAIGVPVMFAGPAVAWAVIPLLMSPFGKDGVAHLGPNSLESYLLASTAASTGLLWIVLTMSARREPVSVQKNVRRQS